MSILQFPAKRQEPDLLEVANLLKDSLDGNVVGESVHIHAHITDFLGEFNGFSHAEFAQFLVSLGAFDNDERVNNPIGASVEFADGQDETGHKLAAFFANDGKAVAALDFSTEVFFGVELVDSVPVAMLSGLLDHAVGFCELLFRHVVDDDMATIE